MAKYKNMVIEVTGTNGLMVNNVQTADPLNKYAKAIKAETSKKTKSDDVYLNIARLKFEASLYINKDGKYYIPSNNLKQSIAAAAAENKLKKKVIQSFQIYERELVLDFKDQGKSVQELFDLGYADTRIGGVSSMGKKSMITITRAYFPDWKVVATCCFDSEQINEEDLLRAINTAGIRYGVGTYRQEYGRFTVKVMSMEDIE